MLRYFLFCLVIQIKEIRYSLLSAIELTSTRGNPTNVRRPQRPVFSSPALPLQTHAYGFFHGVDPSHVWSSYFPTPFQFSQHYWLLQRTLPFHDSRRQNGAFLSLPFYVPQLCSPLTSKEGQNKTCSILHRGVYLQSSTWSQTNLTVARQLTGSRKDTTLNWHNRNQAKQGEISCLFN